VSPALRGGFYFNSSHSFLNLSNFPVLPSAVDPVFTVGSPRTKQVSRTVLPWLVKTKQI